MKPLTTVTLLATPVLLTLDWPALAVVLFFVVACDSLITREALAVALVLAEGLLTTMAPALLFEAPNQWLAGVALFWFFLAPLVDVVLASSSFGKRD